MVLISSLRLRKIVSFKYSFATLSLRAIYHSGRVSRTSAKVSPLGSRLLSPHLSRTSFYSLGWNLNDLGFVTWFCKPTLALSLKNSLKTNAIPKEKFVFDLYSLCDKITKLTTIHSIVVNSAFERTSLNQNHRDISSRNAFITLVERRPIYLASFWRYLSRGRLREIRAG